jgi:hypothetical protein
MPYGLPRTEQLFSSNGPSRDLYPTEGNSADERTCYGAEPAAPSPAANIRSVNGAVGDGTTASPNTRE